ncbi:MAG: hypothetical protein GPJ54_05200 [Candidatus Heimdallarchaeota archaeon]|nr:hypothetical protein [Candidatus Heimdallarchaeota archaeon]
MNQTLKKSDWAPRPKAYIIADEDVDGITSAAIVGRRYDNEACKFTFVNARNLGIALNVQLNELKKQSDHKEIDLFIVDVGINQANINSIGKSASEISKLGVRILYFDSHSNRYKGKNLLLHLVKANAHVFNGKIGVAAASIVQDFLGTNETNRLRLLGALSDRELQLTNRYKSEKTGLRALQAAVAWGAYKNPEFLEKITRRLIRHPDIDLQSDKDILEYSIKANNHRDNLLRHVHRKGEIIQISETPRILCVSVLDRTDFGKARGTVAGRLAGEWGAAIILITQSVNHKDAYAVTVRNSYIHKLDLEVLGQLAKTENSGGSKGAYRLTIEKDDLLSFISRVQAWSRGIAPPWFVKTVSNKPNYKSGSSKYSKKMKHKKQKPSVSNKSKPNEEKITESTRVTEEEKISSSNQKAIEQDNSISATREDVLDLSDIDLDD